jgi:branched-chain amino acid transport system ATP-binding protein
VAGMNPSESLSLMKNIRRLVDEENITIILIEHDMKVVMGFSDEITVINHGEVIARGTPQEIQKHETVIEAYLGHGRAGCALEKGDAENGV